MRECSITRLSVLVGLAFFLFAFLPSAPVRAQACVCCPSCGVCCGDGAVKAAAENASKSSQTAAYKAQWANEAASWLKQFSFFTTIIALFNQFNDFIGNNFTTITAITGGVQQAATEARVRLGQGVADSNHQSQAAQAVAQVAGAVTPPSENNQTLCNVIVARQGRNGANWWQQMLGGQIAQLIQDRNRGRGAAGNQYAANKNVVSPEIDGAAVIKVGMVGNRYRGSGTDGSGPQYAGDERDLRCGTINGVKTANPIDGYPASCIPSDTGMIDADIRFGTLDGTQVFEVPPLIAKTILGGTVTIRVPTATTKPQQLYVAASNFCAFAAGPRPSPPNGKDLDSPEGMVQTAAFNHISSQESAFVTQCANRVAYLTRPNCADATQYADPGIKATCDAANKACAAFVAENGQLPKDIDPTGSNTCPNGLSPYQMEYISHMTCTLSQFYTSGAGAGLNHGRMMNFSTLCNLGIDEWRGKIAKENLNLIKAFNGLSAVNYSGAEANPSKTNRINAPGLKPKSRDSEQASADAKPAAKAAVARKKAVQDSGRLVPDLISLSAPAAQ